MSAPDNELVARVQRITRAYGRGILTSQEAVVALFDYFAADASVSTHLAEQVILSIPDSAMASFRTSIEAALMPDYRKPAWFYGGGRPRTDEENEQESRLLTFRIRAWAERLRSILERSAT